MKKLTTLLLVTLVFSLFISGLSRAVTIQLTTTADISGASQDPSGNYYVTEGESFDVDLNVLNPSSSEESATNVEATLSLPSGLSTTDSLTKTVSSSLSPGDDADVSWTVTGDIAGNYLGQIEINTQGTNTAQNEDTTGILVKSPATIVGGVSCSATDSKVIKSDFDVTVTVQNLGDLEATGISINLSSSPSDISITNPKTISSIDGGESDQETYSSLSSTQTIPYTFTATVTSDNAGSDSADCTTETVNSLPNGFVCTSKSHCSSGCCSGSLCKAAAACEAGNGDGNGGGGAVGGGGPPSEFNTSRRPELVPGVGLRDNLKLRAAIQKVLGMANMSDQARLNLLRLSESITSQVQMTRNLRSVNRTSTMETKLKYTGNERAKNFMLFDQVPKDFAQHADNITITSPGASVEIVEADPDYLITYPQVDPGQEVVITYSVGATVDEDVIDSFSGEVYVESLEAAPVTCTEGQTQCSLNNVMVCQSGEYVFQETCEFGCSGGVCNLVPPTGLEDYALWIVIAVISIVAVVVLVMLFLRKKPRTSHVAKEETKQSPEPLTPGYHPYRPGSH
jgi:hypothetical protein